MKTIDKTSSLKSNEWGYGTILKCWNDNPFQYDLYRIARSHAKNDDYELDILHDRDNQEDAIWRRSAADVGLLEARLKDCYDHIVPVKATIIIEDL